MTQPAPHAADATKAHGAPGVASLWLTRGQWGLVALVSAIVLLLSSYLMARRVVAFHKANVREVYAFKRMTEREFPFAGRTVSLQDDLTNPTVPLLKLRYGDAEKTLTPTVPPEPGSPRWKLPGLLPHEDWLRVLIFAPRGGMTTEQWIDRLEKGEIETRLVLVARIPHPGADAETWGSVWKNDWSFDFYELTPTGEIKQFPRLKYPSTRGLAPPKEGELHENTWQFQAALQTMPQAGAIGPTHNFFGNGIGAAGWTLPLAAFSGLALTIALVFRFAPRAVGGASFRQA